MPFFTYDGLTLTQDVRIKYESSIRALSAGGYTVLNEEWPNDSDGNNIFSDELKRAGNGLI